MSLLSRLAVSAARAYGVLSSNKNNVSASYLVVAGGGAGGTVGGGGAGGYQASTATLSTLNIYSITVGAGAVGIQGAGGAVGSNSVLSGTGLTTITSIGGGGGSAESVAGSTGGSGGGGGGSVAVRSGLAGTSGQGFAGGDGADNGIGTIFVGGGGGGASAVGSNASSSSVAGSGGNGTASSISGSSVTYAGGGGGGGYVTGGTATAGTGGTGGGGNGGRNGLTATSGTTNTGSGGGGGGYTSAGSYQGAAGSGGSGVVIISYTSATPKFVGGTLTTSGGNQIHTFTSSGTLSPLTPITASYLVVAGGGSGGTDGSGGGGAGGLLTSSTTLYSGATYIVTVGAGGAGLGVSSATGNNGSNSSLSGTGLTTITSTGGGGGGYYSAAGNAGGSGGGGGGLGPYGGGAGTSGQGNNGGTGLNSTNYYGGGGGGAGAVGASATSAGGGAGGIGSTSSISGTSTYYAGGGGGAGDSRSNAGGAGGLGGGGASNASSAGVSGTANTGGGGGAGGYITRTSGAGGSGTVIISYAGSQVFNGGLVTSSGGNTIHTFNATGALTPLTNNLNNSLRFRSSASAYLNRTPIASNRKTWTWSGWAKLGSVITTGNGGIFGVSGGNDTDLFSFRFESNTIKVAGAATLWIQTTQVFRDPSAWYHIVLAIDTTQATSANRIKLYINGNQVTALSTAVYPSQNADLGINRAAQHNIYADYNALSYLDGYLADVNFIDGQALEPYYFGNNDANLVWKPILYKGTYGTNGFYLTFADTSALTTSSNAGLGKDTSGNGNYWATNNISITAGTTYDAMLDVPTNTSATVGNYCVMNPLGNAVGSAPATLSDANLTCKNTATSYLGALGTMGLPTSGKFYWEVQLTQNSGASNLSVFGIAPSTVPLTGNQANYANSIAWYMGNTTIIQLPVSGAISISGSGSITTDVFQICYDGSTGKVYFGKNNTFYNSAGASTGNPSSGTNETATLTTGDLLPWFYAYQEGAYFNFGQRPFTYTAPTGYVALNTYNLPTPTILQGNLYMDATLYTGTGTSLVTVNAGQFKPDFVWTKCRSFGYDHGLFDSVRGVTKLLSSNSTAAETTQANTLTSFNSNGFTVVANGATGVSGDTYVGWQWQAGQGSSSSNTDGTITSTVSVNATAGFSIVTYTGIGSSPKTVGHGLGVAPKMIFLKNRGSAVNWYVWHTSLGATQAIEGLNTTSAATTQATFNSTLPTSSVISLGNNDSNNSGSTYVLYVWAEIAGFSKFGSYTGNGSTDGPFVFTGFRPKFVIFKLSSAAGGDWKIIDASRSAYNVAGNELSANTSAAESTGATDMDMLSNGFKIRATYGDTNSSGATYIYAAYAENPFKNANAR